MFVQNNLNKQCSDLCSDIDEKLYQLSNKELNSIKSGMKPINYDDFIALVDYKEILRYSRHGSPCLEYCIDEIAQLLRKRLNSLC
jgi:hypothetical protein